VDSTGTAWTALRKGDRSVWLLQFDGTAWSAQEVPAPNGANTLALALDPQDRPHLLLQRRGDLDLRWMRWDDPDWTTDAVPRRHDLNGMDIDLTVDAQGVPHLIHTDLPGPGVVYRYRDGDDWVVGGSVGAHLTPLPLQLQLDAAGRPHVWFVSYLHEFEPRYAVRIDGAFYERRITDGEVFEGLHGGVGSDGIPLAVTSRRVWSTRDHELGLHTISMSSRTPPDIISLTVDPPVLVAGEPLRIGWETSGALVTALDPLQPPAASPDGQLVTSLTKDTTLTLRAANLFGTDETSVLVP